MALVPIKQLDGPGGYLRWKESVLLRLHTLGVARVLFEDRPAGDGGDAAAAKKWARDDAVCRGHVLASLSDRLLPDYARFAAAADLWRALARTYDVETRSAWRDRFHSFEFDEGAGDALLEQIAHAEALGAAARLPDDYVADELCGKLPEIVGHGVLAGSQTENETAMNLVWDVARRVVASGIEPERLWKTAAMSDDDYQDDGFYIDGPKRPEQNTGRRNRAEPELVARSCRRKV
ncbi:uncharacterized protein LOC120678128 [Panicum virgatum]|uniref:Uncharacterized protein n=1 Tax=Panicum virgatum TaxID=38727 RepID=A0A8T0R0U7_PANVG|nr:uncharacterized protein LOC120678128 [Panicum virgatum]KAG2578759.1 hypothetical protein PVAP13_6NG114206 [Panicum virgatum]